ncbi:hypothetical protein MLD38_004294 [Melastoma candidum]|uniref:Uncharacterized protein n=1 Tax=Melastoma candidum TaxID=119954 RepID=A0ACB9S6K0_9MYRT|nr:hypothetical protein MLD38_004294 [Melastoma candidum]
MAAPNMAAITASLERSFQIFSLNPSPSPSSSSSSSSPSTIEPSPSATRHHPHNEHLLLPNPSDDTVLELNSSVSLPYHWEQCLDLETGEIYYINWRNGMRSTEDPRLTSTVYDDGEYYSSSDESHYDSEESSSESPPSSSRDRLIAVRSEKDRVLVVGGCKSCLMYFMVPRRVEDCPKCTGQLIHFDRSEDGGGSSP